MNVLTVQAIAWTMAALALLVPVLISQKGRITPLAVTIFLLAPLVGGHVLLDAAQPPDGVTLLYFVGLVALVLGYCITRTNFWAVSPRPIATHDYLWPITFALVVFVALSIYHLAVTGIPILSGNVEIARFDFTSSGLAGLPGRAYLYGLPIATTLAIFNATRYPTKESKALMILSVGLLLLFHVVSGFKGAIVEFAIVVLFAATTSSARATIKRMGARYLPLGAAAAVYAIAVMPGYTSYAGMNSQEVLYTLVDRITEAGATPGHMVMKRSSELIELPANITALDASYTMYRYFGIDLGQRFDFDQIVAASITHTGLSNSSAPVTIGAFPQLVYDYGPIVAVVGAFMLGIFYRRLEAIAQSTESLNAYMVSVGALLALNAYLTKGDLVYLIVNWTAMLLFTLLLVNIPRLLSKPREESIPIASQWRDLHSGVGAPQLPIESVAEATKWGQPRDEGLNSEGRIQRL